MEEEEQKCRDLDKQGFGCCFPKTKQTCPKTFAKICSHGHLPIMRAAQADEISLTLKDNEGKWAGSWKPDGGENIKMYLSAGTTEEPGPEAFLGTFFVDYQRISGAPRVYELRAVSIPLNKPVRKTQKNRAWENHSLQEIAQEICRDAELELFFDSVENPQYQRIDQSSPKRYGLPAAFV